MVKRSNERNTRASLAGPTVASQKVSLSDICFECVYRGTSRAHVL